ncbi:hypothetical protein SLS62_001762 [Diatrype stigma]|uniref:Uncharacterized protein n=1 Tax=Diatrype stigma TaxID=117547 RepID=A0AAN9YW89_9PEZI
MCHLQHTTITNSRAPLISAVCHEASSVVYENLIKAVPGLKDKHGNAYPDWVSKNHNTNLLICRGIDTIHLNWHSSYEADNPRTGTLSTRPLLSLLWISEKVADISINAEVILPFNERGYDVFKHLAGLDLLGLLSLRGHYFVCLRIIGLHIHASNATRSGLFGMLGDERIKLVNVHDTDTLAKYRAAWKLYGPPSSPGATEDPDADQFFTEALDNTICFEDRVKVWQDDLKKIWISARVLFLQDRQRKTNITEGLWLDETEPPGLLNLNLRNRRLNTEHPWIQEELARMPHFEPVVMFRQCSQNCHVEYQDRIGNPFQS